MLVIRLQRTGRKNLATYRLVVTEKARAVKGKFLEIVGHYLPQQDPKVLQVKQDKVTTWISKGAIPSDTVARLLKRDGMKDMEKFISRYPKRKSKNPEEVVAEAPAPAPVAAPTPVAEAPAAVEEVTAAA